MVLAPGIIISLDTEFIENENGDVSKNDCELNAAKRLLEWLGRDYPRLPVCLQGGALYAAEPVMQIYLSYSPLRKEIGQSIKIHLHGYWKVFEDKQ